MLKCKMLKCKMMIIVIVLTVCGACFDSGGNGNLEPLPVVVEDTHVAYQYRRTRAPYGFYLYAPVGYIKGGDSYPLLIFLHGAGEVGNSSYDKIILDRVLTHGPPKLIENKTWETLGPKEPMIVVSPQCHETEWNSTKVHNFIKFIIENFQVDTSRIYMTGVSMGGHGTFMYCLSNGRRAYVAAVVPICGIGYTGYAAKMKHIPTWAFHGGSDAIVGKSESINMVKAINDSKPTVKALITIYSGVGHDSWTCTYDSTGMGKESTDYDAFGQDIYSWMLQYSK